MGTTLPEEKFLYENYKKLKKYIRIQNSNKDFYNHDNYSIYNDIFNEKTTRIYYKIDNDFYFIYDVRKNILFCSNSKIWSVLRENSKLESSDIINIIKKMICIPLNIKNAKPIVSIF